MSKNALRIAVLAMVAAAVLTGCDLFKSERNHCEFTVSGGTSTETFEWGTEHDDIGFLQSSGGYYFAIFSGDDRAEDDDTFYNYLFLDIVNPWAGTYSAAEDTASVSYYDAAGKSYFSFSSDAATNATITVTKWDDKSVEGTFSAVLRNLDGSYRTLAGSFKSFDSSGSRSLSADSLLGQQKANRLNQRISIPVSE